MALTNEDLQAISQLLDTKIGGALQPVKDEIREVKEDLKEIKEDVRDLKVRMGNVEKDVRDVKERMGDVEKDVRDLKERMGNVEEDVRGIKLHLENVTDRNISILAENYVPAAKRYESAADEIQALKTEQEIMKKVITKHSEILRTLVPVT